MSDQPQPSSVTDNPQVPNRLAEQVGLSGEKEQTQRSPASAPPLWERLVRIMSILGVVGLVAFVVYMLVVFNQVNQWDTVNNSFANGMLHVRVSFPQNVGRDETSRLHVVVENVGEDAFSNLRVGFTSNGIARFRNSEALFDKLLANSQRNATLEYTVENASVVRDSNIQLAVHVYYTTATLPISGTTVSTMTPVLQSAPFAEPISISINPDREYFLKADALWNDVATKLPAILISIISAIGALVSISVEGGPGNILQWLVRPPTPKESTVMQKSRGSINEETG